MGQRARIKHIPNQLEAADLYGDDTSIHVCCQCITTQLTYTSLKYWKMLSHVHINII